MLSTLPATTSAERRFEFIQGGSNKFWQLTVQGTEVSVVYGRIGTSGQTNNKQFATTADALKHADKLIDQKTAKGYVETV